MQPSSPRFPVIADGCSVSLVGRPPVEALVLRPVAASNGNGNGHAPTPAGEDMFLLPSPIAVALFLRCDGTRTPADICADALATANADASTIEGDVDAFLDDLAARDLIAWLAAPLAAPRRADGVAAGDALPAFPSLWLPSMVHPFQVESDISTALVLSATFTGGFGNTNGALPCGQSGGLGNAAAQGPCSSGQGNLNIFGNRQCGGGGFLNLFGGPGCGG
ncbi:MAG: PqqD family protein [Planctomycetota bacterium]